MSSDEENLCNIFNIIAWHIVNIQQNSKYGSMSPFTHGYESLASLKCLGYYLYLFFLNPVFLKIKKLKTLINFTVFDKYKTVHLHLGMEEGLPFYPWLMKIRNPTYFNIEKYSSSYTYSIFTYLYKVKLF